MGCSVHQTKRHPPERSFQRYCFVIKLGKSTTFFSLLLFWQVLRDGLDPSGRDRRQQAQGGDTQSGGRHCQLQEAEPDHVRLGDPRPALGRWRLRPGQHPQRQLHQQVTIETKPARLRRVCVPNRTEPHRQIQSSQLITTPLTAKYL